MMLGEAIRRSLTAPRLVAIDLDRDPGGGPVRDHVAAAVCLGLANVLPARCDPLFRRRLGRRAPGVAHGVARGAILTSKLAVLGETLTQRTGVHVWVLDAGRSGRQLTLGLSAAGAPGDRYVLRTAVACEPRRGTTELLILACGTRRDASRAIDDGLALITALCGGRAAARAHCELSAHPQRLTLPLAYSRGG